VGASACSSVAIVTPDRVISCTLPSGIGRNVSVIATRGAQSSAAVNYVSYAGPIFTPNTIRLNNTLSVVSFGPGARAVGNSTRGGRSPVFFGC
jgi:hypothetical protein